jgi:hypothetical protein
VSGQYEDEQVFADLHDAQTSDKSVLVWLDCTWESSSDPHVPRRVLAVRQAGRFNAGGYLRISRLASIAALPSGWLEGEGDRVQVDALERCVTILRPVQENGLPDPSIFPSLAGGVRLEWAAPNGLLVVTLDSSAAARVEFTAPLAERPLVETVNDSPGLLEAIERYLSG